jgi:hypothetical protein
MKHVDREGECTSFCSYDTIFCKECEEYMHDQLDSEFLGVGE